MSRFVHALAMDVQGMAARIPFFESLLLTLIIMVLLVSPARPNTVVDTVQRVVRIWIADAMEYWGLVKPVPVPVLPAAKPKQIRRAAVTPVQDGIHLNELEFRQNYQFHFKGIVTVSGLPSGGAKVVIRMEYDGHPQLMEVITNPDGSYSADMPFLAPVNSRIDWTLQIHSADNPIVFEKSGRSIVTRDELDVEIEEPIEFHLASAK